MRVVAISSTNLALLKAFHDANRKWLTLLIELQ
jgi:hypothetical protein